MKRKKAQDELSYEKAWKGVSIQDFILKMDANIHWYNKKELRCQLETLDHLSSRSKNMKDKTIA